MTDRGERPVGGDEIYRGVSLCSRYGLLAEIRELRCIVDALAPPLRNRVESIFCDSKACAVFTVEMKPGPWTDSWIDVAAVAFATATHGHNGVTIQVGTVSHLIPPFWDDEPDALKH